MAGFAKAFGAVTDAASTAWGLAKHLSTSSPDQPKGDVSGDRSLRTLDLHPSRRNPLEDSLTGMFAGMVKSGETILESWMKRDGEDVEVFEQFCLLASELVSITAFGKNCSEANNKSPHMGWVVKKNDASQFKKHEQTKTMDELFRNDFLGKLIATNGESEKNKKYSNEEEIAEECKAFCFVGCTATASFLGWAIHMLSRDKNLQERARNEVIEIFGCEDPNPEGIEKLTVMDKILEDCARLYPLVPFKLKVNNGDAEQPDKDKSNPTVFHFGHGRGAWLGMNFAKLEAKVVLSMILRRFVFTLSPAYIHSPVRGFTVTPKHGIRVILQVRREESKTIKIIKTVGIVAGVAVAAWGVTKLLGSFGPDEPVSKPEEGKKVKMMKNPGRSHELIARNPFEETPAQRFRRNRELTKAEKLAKRGLGIK